MIDPEDSKNHKKPTNYYPFSLIYEVCRALSIFDNCMNSSGLKDKKIAQLVDENYVHAYVLFYFGILFDQYSDRTLEQVCLERGLKLEQIERELESPTHLKEDDLPLISYPVDLIIEYLKHSHFLFIKHKLPYIAKLVESFQSQHDDYRAMERDLKLVLPLFVEDFIHHIYEEEDTLFCYIKTLDRASREKLSPTKLYYLLEKHSIQEFSMEHEMHNEEMAGIRKITKEYAISASTPLHVKILYQELKEFEKSLIAHARIENEILFPKAMALETRVRQAFFEHTKLN